ncbi:MAG: leucine-rich repeat protein [Clostridia bacterium]|nr:leucine-rich repeat protein [Clostridia bacterium]
MQRRKRILSLLLAVVMVVGLSQAGVLTNGLLLRASAETVSGTCGASGNVYDVRWTLDKDSGVLTISGTGAMKDYYSGTAPWTKFCDLIKTVSIGSGVTKLGDYAFYNCTSLASVTIPDSVTQIGDSAFENCTCITDMTIPSGVKHLGSSAFSKCTGLTNLTFNAVKCTILHSNNDNYYAFTDCTALQTVTFGETVETIPAEILFCCPGLRTVTILPGVKEIGRAAFCYCANLADVNMSDSVTRIGDYAFSGCTSLTHMNVGNGVTEIGYSAFSLCSSLTRVTLGNAVETIGYSAFAKSPLTGIFIPRSVREIGQDAFSCGIRTDEYDLNTGYGIIPTLQTIEVDPDNAYYCVRDGVLFNKAQTVLIQYPNADPRTEYLIPNGVTDVGDDDFYYCTNLKSVHVPFSVNSIGSDAFTGCSSLIYICSDFADNYYTRYIADQNGFEFRLCDGHGSPARVPGDANGDGVLDLKDVIRIRRFLAGGWNVTLIESASDVDADRAVTLQDAVLILRSLAGGWDVTLQ